MAVKELKAPTVTLSPDDINELMKDWFCRSGETFTRITADHKLDWESGDTYSDYFTGGKIAFEDLMVKSYDWARETLVVMELPIKWKLAMLKGSSSYTDGKQIVLSTQIFDDKDYTNGEKVDIYLGLAVHEGAHILYTDFKEYRKRCKNKIVASLQNIYEDERIEMLIGEHKPGLTRFLEKTKYHYFDKLFMDMPEVEEITAENVWQQAFNCLLRIIRFPKYLNEKHFEFFGEHLVRIREVLTPYPTSTEQVCDAALATYEILKEFIDEKFEDADPEKMEEMTDEAADEIERMLKESGMVSEAETDKDETKSAKGLTRTIADIAEGRVERGGDKTFVERASADGKDQYRESYRKIAPYIAAIRKAISYNDKDYKIVHKGMRSGLLDENKLIEALAGVPTVYKRTGEVKSDKIAVCFVIDESGSMGGGSIQIARDCAILLYEALKSNRSIDLYIYGHSADIRATYHTELYVYSEPGYRPKWSLGTCRAKSQNRDGDAILESAKRVRKFTKRKCLMFVLSDGAPCAADYDGSSGIRDTRNKVTKVQKMGFDVVQIAINHSYNPAEMFDNYVIFDDMRTLAKDMNKYVKRQILRKQNIKIS